MYNSRQLDDVQYAFITSGHNRFNQTINYNWSRDMTDMSLWRHRLWLLPSGAVAPPGNKHKINHNKVISLRMSRRLLPISHIGLWLHWVWLWTDGRTDGWTDIFSLIVWDSEIASIQIGWRKIARVPDHVAATWWDIWAVCCMVLTDDNFHYPLIPSNPFSDLSELIECLKKSAWKLCLNKL